MSNGDAVFAPTPIVRITAEQLEYLISRLRNSDRDRKRNWQYKSYHVQVNAGTAGQILTVSEARKWVWFSAETQNFLFAPTDVIGSQDGVIVTANSPMALPLSYDDIGWPLTRSWSAFNLGAAPGTALALEMSGP